MGIVTVEGLTKTYKRLGRPPYKAVDGLSLEIPETGAFGFLGPNGSGKTTTIRMLLGLIRPDSGRMALLGHAVPDQLHRALPEVGALVEMPTLYPHFTGRQNLRVLVRTAGLPERRVDECLDMVGLRDRASDRVRGYSLGMRQRLAIAAAMAKRPRLLILDEPTNGLDPGGIREVRDLIRTISATGETTVFLSSHLLGEVQQTCDEVAIMDRGRCVANGSVKDVLEGGQQTRLRIRVPRPREATEVLTAAGITVRPEADMLSVEGVADPGVITRLLAERDLFLTEMTPVTRDLETAFLELTDTGPALPSRQESA